MGFQWLIYPGFLLLLTTKAFCGSCVLEQLPDLREALARPAVKSLQTLNQLLTQPAATRVQMKRLFFAIQRERDRVFQELSLDDLKKLVEVFVDKKLSEYGYLPGFTPAATPTTVEELIRDFSVRKWGGPSALQNINSQFLTVEEGLAAVLEIQPSRRVLGNAYLPVFERWRQNAFESGAAVELQRRLEVIYPPR